jgi:PAS domain S-box-containing protein
MSSSPEEAESENAFQLEGQSSLDPHVIVRARRDVDGGIVDFDYLVVNDRALVQLGLTRDQVLRSSVRATSPRLFADEMVSWLSTVVTSKTPTERHDVTFLRPRAKSMGRFDVRGVGDGDLVSYSFRERTETRDLIDRYRLLLEDSSDIVVRTTAGNLQEWTFDVATSVLGYAPEEMLGVSLEDLMDPLDESAHREFRERFDSAEIVRSRLRLRAKDGDYHYFAASVHRVLDGHGAVSEVVATLHLIDDEVAAQEAGASSNERYRLMSQYGTDVVALERHGAIEWVSPYVEKLLHLSCDEVVGHPLADLVHPDDRASLQTFYRGVDDVVPLTLTLRMRMADSSSRWVSLRSREVSDVATGERVRVSSWRDAQEDVAAQRALIASESRFRLLAENSTDVVVECDAQGVVRWLSPSAQATLGWRAEDLVGRMIDGLVLASDLVQLAQQRAAMSSRTPTAPVEIRYFTSTGNVKWMSQQMSRVHGAGSEADMVILALRDVDEGVRIRGALARVEENFQLLANNVTDVVYTVNLDGEALWVSPSIQEQLGWQFADITGHNILDLVYPEDRARVMAWRRLLHLGETLDELVIRVRRSSGSFVWMKARARPTFDAAGLITGVVVALRNCENEVVTARALRTISAGNRLLMRVHDEKELLHSMCQIAVDEGGYAMAWYGKKRDDASHRVEVVASSSGHDQYLEDLVIHWNDDEFAQGPTGRAFRTGQTCTSSDIDVDVTFEPWRTRARQNGFRSTAAIPVRVDGRVHGTWQVYAGEPRAFESGVLSVLEDMALEIGFGLSRMTGG